jgi:chromatin structure-remodeling complex subunit RSC3/30
VSHLASVLILQGIDYRTWQKMGDLSTISSAIGLHQLNGDEDCPFFLTEIRKRVMASAYAMDKELATTLGRPPRICSRYCHIQLPLDLSDVEITASPEEIDLALQKLDANGWNTCGEPSHEVKLRIAVLTSLIRENTLELSMCNSTSDLEAKVEYVIFSVRKTYCDINPKTTRQYSCPINVSLFIEKSFRMLARCSKIFQHIYVGRLFLQE